MERLRNWFFAVLSLIFIGSCEQEEIECLRVTGEIETQKRTVGDFNKVFFNDVGNLHISQGNEPKVLLKGQQSILQHLKVSVNNDELLISLDHCFNGEDYQLDIFVTSPDWERISMAGVGNLLTGTPVVAENLTVILSGIIEKCELDVTADSLSTILSGKGNIVYTGTLQRHKILLSGVGDVKAYGQPVKAADVSMTGYGDVFVEVSETLNVDLRGDGNLFYKGNPFITENEAGAGNVIDDN